MGDHVLGTLDMNQFLEMFNGGPKKIKLYGHKIYFFTNYIYNLVENNFKCIRCKAKGDHFRIVKTNPKALEASIYLHGKHSGRKITITNDHIKPRSIGGPNCIHNYQPLCSDCNNYKGDKWDIFDRVKYIVNCITYRLGFDNSPDRCNCTNLLSEALKETVRIFRSYFLLDLFDARYDKFTHSKKGRHNEQQKNSGKVA